MKRLFVLTPQATTDLQEILLDLADENPDVAEHLLFRLYQGLQRLARSPGIGHYHEELLDRRYRFWNFYFYVIAYAWQARPIEILAVVHGRRDLATFFESRTND